jgi:uncharacterized protein with PQ loop repeat
MSLNIAGILLVFLILIGLIVILRDKKMDNLEIKIMGGLSTTTKTILMDSIFHKIKQTKVHKACSIKDNILIPKCLSLWRIKATRGVPEDPWALWEVVAFSIMIIWVPLAPVELPTKC